ncbi:BCCT family transporter, partial [Bacillus altitudinis]
FWIVIAITFIAVLWGAFSPESLQNVTDQIQTYITNDFGWYYLLVVSL